MKRTLITILFAIILLSILIGKTNHSNDPVFKAYCEIYLGKSIQDTTIDDYNYFMDVFMETDEYEALMDSLNMPLEY